MAAVLQFELRQNDLERAPVPAQGAEIIIFPGVRFEHFEPHPDTPMPPNGGESDGSFRHRALK